jgi:hypothetical protein
MTKPVKGLTLEPAPFAANREKTMRLLDRALRAQATTPQGGTR